MIPLIYDEAEFDGCTAFFDQLRKIESEGKIVPATEMTSGRALCITGNPDRLDMYHEAGYAVVLLENMNGRENAESGFEPSETEALKMKMHAKPDVVLLDIEGADPEWLVHVYERKYGIPWEILRTERTIVREECYGDLDALYELYAGEGITDYVEPLYEREEEEKYLNTYIEYIYRFYEYGMWCVFDRKTGELIGRIGIDPHEYGEELGYIVASHRQNEGIATEVCRAVVDYARDELGLTKLVIRTDKRNAPSIHIAEKLGFKKIRELEEDRDTLRIGKAEGAVTTLWELEL